MCQSMTGELRLKISLPSKSQSSVQTDFSIGYYIENYVLISVMIEKST